MKNRKHCLEVTSMMTTEKLAHPVAIENNKF